MPDEVNEEKLPDLNEDDTLSDDDLAPFPQEPKESGESRDRDNSDSPEQK